MNDRATAGAAPVVGREGAAPLRRREGAAPLRRVVEGGSLERSPCPLSQDDGTRCIGKIQTVPH